MKKGKKAYRRERGQATMEIAIAAVAIVFLVTGFFAISGVGLTSIKSLLETRYYAEEKASDQKLGDGNVFSPIASWTYTRIEQGSAVVEVPFLGRDRSHSTAITLGSSYLTELAPSLSERPEMATDPQDADYVWQPFDSVVNHQIESFNSARLASLYRQSPVLPDEIRTDQNYLFNSIENSGEMKRRLKDGGWINIQSIDITDWESSVVAFPAFGRQK